MTKGVEGGPSQLVRIKPDVRPKKSSRLRNEVFLPEVTPEEVVAEDVTASTTSMVRSNASFLTSSSSTLLSTTDEVDFFPESDSLTPLASMHSISKPKFVIPAVTCNIEGSQSRPASITHSMRSANNTPMSVTSFGDRDSASILGNTPTADVMPKSILARTPPPVDVSAGLKPKPFDRLGILEVENSPTMRVKSPLIGAAGAHFVTTTARAQSPFATCLSPSQRMDSPDIARVTRTSRFAPVGPRDVSPFRKLAVAPL